MTKVQFLERTCTGFVRVGEAEGCGVLQLIVRNVEGEKRGGDRTKQIGRQAPDVVVGEIEVSQKVQTSQSVPIELHGDRGPVGIVRPHQQAFQIAEGGERSSGEIAHLAVVYAEPLEPWERSRVEIIGARRVEPTREQRNLVAFQAQRDHGVGPRGREVTEHGRCIEDALQSADQRLVVRLSFFPPRASLRCFRVGADQANADPDQQQPYIHLTMPPLIITKQTQLNQTLFSSRTIHLTFEQTQTGLISLLSRRFVELLHSTRFHLSNKVFTTVQRRISILVTLARNRSESATLLVRGRGQTERAAGCERRYWQRGFSLPTSARGFPLRDKQLIPTRGKLCDPHYQSVL